MSITQAVEIPASHRLVLDVPREVPTGPVILTFTPAPALLEQSQTQDILSFRTGFLQGPISVPEDFDTMGQEEIRAMFGIDS